MNESETRAELIDPKLAECGWGRKITEGSHILREREAEITKGKILIGGGRAKLMKADYILVYKGVKLAVVEAKSDELEVGEGVAQAKEYAQKLQIETTYATNGKEIYYICLKTGEEKLVDRYLTPEELWRKTFPPSVSEVKTAVKTAGIDWQTRFNAVPFEDINKTKPPRFYQELAVNHVLKAIANDKDRILLTLATGTGKTTIAFHIAWKLYQSRWNLKQDGTRRPRILFLAHRNILSDQAYGEFSRYVAFKEDALLRISPKAIREINDDGKKIQVNTFITNEQKNKVRVPTNGNVFFTIFQTFMTGKNKDVPNFGEYPKDFFDLIIIDECHIGGANDESTWRAILEYFSPAVQLGLTATPKRTLNVDTYKYFGGEPVYTYSLKDGINDGFLTPFKVQRIQSTLDDYVYTNDDTVVEGEVEEGKLYKEADFNKIIEIKAREKARVEQFLSLANPKEKTIIFCANQPHAALIRDLVNQCKDKSMMRYADYCVRVTANDGERGEEFLREFQDNEKTIPTILTTSQKLSTGVDARNIRNIVLLRPVNSIIEFKQIIGRGTRLFEGKEFFTIYDFVNAYEKFNDKEWDGPAEEDNCKKCGQNPCQCTPSVCEDCGQHPCECAPQEPQTCEKCEQTPCICQKKVKVKIALRKGKELDIQYTVATSYWSVEGKPVSLQAFLNHLFGKIPDLFQDEAELRKIWGNPLTRKTLLDKLEKAGIGKAELTTVQSLINAHNSDLFDVLEFLFNTEIKPITREARVAAAQATIYALLNEKQKEFIAFVLKKYIESGVEELDQAKLPILLTSKYQSIPDAGTALGDLAKIKELFITFQQYLYEKKVA
jgi:type I restriction enzyme, R subunit